MPGFRLPHRYTSMKVSEEPKNMRFTHGATAINTAMPNSRQYKKSAERWPKEPSSSDRQ
jgi:hypothetical protein